MRIYKVELKDGGMNGIIVHSTAMQTKENNESVPVDISKTYKVPVPRELIEKIQRLKQYITIVLNVGLEPQVKRVLNGEKSGNELISIVNFMDSVSVTKFDRSNDNFVLCGKICNMDNHTIGFASPLICPDTQYGIYEELNTDIDEICKDVMDFVEGARLVKMKPVDYIGKLFPDEPEKVNKPENELEEDMIRILESKGHLVIPRENYTEQQQGSTEEPQVTSKIPAVEEEQA